MSSLLYTVLVFVSTCLPYSDGCSSRSTPKPRPPSPTLRPNITIQTYTCPPEYDQHYCLNGATCFTVKIGESILYNCECAEGYMGQRCEFKDLDGSYLPSKQRAILEQAGMTSFSVIIVLMVVIVCFYCYVQKKRRPRSPGDEVDGRASYLENQEPLPFSRKYEKSHSISISQNVDSQLPSIRPQSEIGVPAQVGVRGCVSLAAPPTSSLLSDEPPDVRRTPHGLNNNNNCSS